MQEHPPGPRGSPLRPLLAGTPALCPFTHSPLPSDQPSVSLSTGAQGQASPRGGGCLQARARLTESKAWEGDLPLKPGCGLSSATLGTPQTQVSVLPSAEGGGARPSQWGHVRDYKRELSLGCGTLGDCTWGVTHHKPARSLKTGFPDPVGMPALPEAAPHHRQALSG